MIRIYFIAVMSIIFLAGCDFNDNSKAAKHAGENMQEEHSHEEENIVRLNKRQMEALHLKTGGFSMRNLSTVIKLNGQLKVSPGNVADVSTVMPGMVKSINVFYGDKVKKGKTLAILRHPDIINVQEQFAAVAGELKYLQQDYLRQKELLDNNVAAKKTFQKAERDYLVAKSKYRALKSKLDLMNISPEDVLNGKIVSTIRVYAPIDGYITAINIKLGAYVDMEDVLFEITNNNDIHADFIVYEQDIPLVHEGQKIHFTVAGNGDHEYTAILYSIEKRFDAGKKAIHVHAKINEKTSSLIPDMYISGHLHTDEKYTRTLPLDAIVKEGTKSYIFVVDSTGAEAGEKNAGKDTVMSFRKVEVITGMKGEGYIEVNPVEDLPKDTKIVLNAAYYLLAEMKKEETEHHH